MSRLVRSLILFTAVVIAAMVVTPPEAQAQSDILLRLRSGSPLGDRFRVDSASGVIAKGVLGIGIIPFTGAGERMMWYPYKAAFRAGGVDGVQWDDANQGFYSVAFGFNTNAKGYYSIATGGISTALGNYSIAMGDRANADGAGAVSLGTRTTADADFSVAIGYRASTNGHAGALVLSDGSTTDSTEASANNQFSARYAGGYRLYTNAAKTTGLQMAAGGSSWTLVSDRNAKENFHSLNNEDILKRIRAIPVKIYNYKDDPYKARHIGPMAQDFHAQFSFSEDGKHINMSDLDGVNLAGVRALEARTSKMQAELKAKDAKIAGLEARIAKLEALMSKK